MDTRACLALVTTLAVSGCAFDAHPNRTADALAHDPSLVTPERAPPRSAQATILERNFIAREQDLDYMYVHLLARERGQLILLRIDAALMRGQCPAGTTGMVCGGIPIPVAAYTAAERQRAGLAQL